MQGSGKHVSARESPDVVRRRCRDIRASSIPFGFGCVHANATQASFDEPSRSPGPQTSILLSPVPTGIRAHFCFFEVSHATLAKTRARAEAHSLR